MKSKHYYLRFFVWAYTVRHSMPKRFNRTICQQRFSVKLYTMKMLFDNVINNEL